MKVNTVVKEWYMNGGREVIEDYFDDVEGIWNSDLGKQAGVYAVSVKADKREILMYIGEVGMEERCFRDRLTEHARKWLGIGKSEFYTGISLEEFKKEGYKFVPHVLAVECDNKKRKALEGRFIAELKPYLQFSCFPKYKSEYCGWDLCIFPTYRSHAWVLARDGVYKEENEDFMENFYEQIRNIDLDNYRNAKPNVEMLKWVKESMPQRSEVHKKVKEYVERNMNIDSKRGIQYSYLVKLIANVLTPTFSEKYSSKL